MVTLLHYLPAYIDTHVDACVNEALTHIERGRSDYTEDFFADNLFVVRVARETDAP